MTYHFSEKEKAEMLRRLKDRESTRKIAKVFRCSQSTICRYLLKKYGDEYIKIVTENWGLTLQENGQKMNTHPNTIAVRPETGRKLGLKWGAKNRQKWNAEHPEERIELGRKVGQLPRTEKQIETFQENGKKLVEWNASHHNWVSRPEQVFFDFLCSQNPTLLIKQQYYLKGLNHPFDVVVPELKQLIEVDGDYTHSRPGRKERDAEINEFVWRTYPNWQLFRYNDEDLRKLGILK